MKRFGFSRKTGIDDSYAPQDKRTKTAHRMRLSGRLAQIIALQRAVGNRAVSQALRRSTGGILFTADQQPVDSVLGAPAGTRHPTRESEVMGGLIGGGIGAAVGAGVGFAAGGPIGALVGGLVGLAVGAAIGAVAGRRTLTGPIADPAIQTAMRSAWTDSDAGSAANRHEEGAYIVRRADGSLGVERWPRGAGASITPPARDASGRYNGLEVLGEFHTHPNPAVDEAGRQWVQGPSPGDLTGIAAEGYPGDSYVISVDEIHVVRPDGSSESLGSRRDIIGD